MKRFQESVKEYFNFPKSERSGIVWLLVACVLFLTFWIGRDAFIATQQGDLKIKYIEEQVESSERSEKHIPPQETELFYFDPNNLPAAEWRKLGLSDKQIRGIHNYEKAGGSFNRKEDVLKMYTISDGMYAELEPFIRIQESIETYSKVDPVPDPRVTSNGSIGSVYNDKPIDPDPKSTGMIEKPELNSADSAGLVRVKGIGPVFARSIIKYRDLLGGYSTLEQLNEVYVLQDKPDAVQKIISQIKLDTTVIRRININTASEKDLASHIYINWNVANAIVAYRNVHGPYKSVPAIMQCALIDDDLMTKIAPYLKVD